MKEYLNSITYSFLATISKIHLTGGINQTIIDDFNANLPKAYIKKLQTSAKKMIVDNSKNDLIDETRIFSTMIMGSPSNEDDKDSFKQIIFQQEFIAYFAHLEGIFQDFQRVIYFSKPELLPEKKEFLWKDILELKDFSKILEFAINEKLNKSGYEKISDLIITLNSSPFLLKISVKNDIQKDVEEFILIRNLIIHNGGKVSKDYEIFTEKKYKRDEPFLLSRELNNQLYDLIKIITVETYASIVSEIFGIFKEEGYKDMSYLPGKEKANYTKQKAKRNTK